MKRLMKNMTLFALIAVVVVFAGCENLLQNDEDSSSSDGDTTPPAEVENLSASSGDEEVTLTWTDPSDRDFDHVEITWTPEEGDPQPKEIGSGTETATIGGLTNGTEYSFTVKTVDTAGNTSTGGDIAATPEDTEAPAEVTNLSASESVREVTVTWTDPTDTDFDHVEITWTPETLDAQPKEVSNGTETATIERLTGGTEYTFTVKTVDDVNNSSNGSEVAAIPEYQIGYTGPAGGIVFYDKGGYSDGWRYLEAAPAETEWTGNEWGGEGTDVAGDDSSVAPELTGIGVGEANTEAIVEEFGSSEPYTGKTDYAAKLCADLEYGGYNDWFLPSKDELDKMYKNLADKGIGDFVSFHYWSSTEYTSTVAWVQSFSSGSQYTYYSKSNSYRVRAVRAF